ncbi:MAG: hypothetical protein ACP5MV_03655 [Candidatus Parvarchaeum sp.]
MQGFLANFQIYNTTLTQAQLSDIYNERLDYKPVSTAIIADLWALNGTIKDYANPAAIGIDSGVTFTINYPVQ